MIGTILLVFAFVLSCIAAWWPAPAPRPWHYSFLALAMACFFLYLLLGHSPLASIR